MVKLAQQRSRVTGADIRQEIARQVVETAILDLDPELGLLIDEESAYSNDDRLVAAFNVNDVVVNGARFDIRLLGEDGRVALPRSILTEKYLVNGSLVVSFNQAHGAQVVSYISGSDWHLQDKHAGAEPMLSLRANRDDAFNLGKLIVQILSTYSEPLCPVLPAPQENEITKFIANQQDIKLADQRVLVDAVLSNPASWQALGLSLTAYSKPAVRKTLAHAAKWNHTLDKLLKVVEPKFNKLSKEDIRDVIARVGETAGGQPQSPQFRQELLSQLTRQELSKSLKGQELANATIAVQSVMSGGSTADAVKAIIKSPAAVDLAMLIKRQRQKLTNFMGASAEELAAAFRQISLQPVYATHSQNPNEGVQAINEALCLIDACELAQGIKELENELSDL